MIIRTQGLVYEIPGIRRKTYLILFNGFLSNSPVLQITAGFRMLEELLVIKTCSRFGEFIDSEGLLMIVFRMFIILNGNPCYSRHGFHGLSKGHVVIFHDEVIGIPRLMATETVKKLLLLAYAEAWSFLGMKRTAGHVA